MDSSSDSVFCSIPEAVAELKAGRFIIIVDDRDRENEGDLVCAAELVTPQMINFMIRKAAGKLCLTLTTETCEKLHLYPQTNECTAEHGTAFTVSIDASSEFGVTTGVSAGDRCATIHRCINKDAVAFDLRRPGHISPLKARPGGVLVRAGHTEASVDLAQLAGLAPAAVIIEILKEDGDVARLDSLIEFAKEHGLKICDIAMLIEYRLQRERSVARLESIPMENQWGKWTLHGYKALTEIEPHLALCMGDIGKLDANGLSHEIDHPILVRVHSQCLTGDTFGSFRCDCGEQLNEAMELISKEGEGVVVYLRQEGRGIGLMNKLHAYRLQDEGMDTVEANEHLGFPADKRDYGVGAQILRDLGVRRIRVLTNNPKKLNRLQVYGLEVVKQEPLIIQPNDVNRRYLETKRTKMGHLLD